MAVETQVVRFQKSTGANGTTQDVNLNFTPKAIFIYSSNQTDDNTQAIHAHVSLGFSDGTNHACVATSSQDAQPSSDNGITHRTDSVIAVLDIVTPTTLVARASVAFATNKITLTWTVNNAVANYCFLYAIGGDDITNVKVATVENGTTANGNVDYTGLGFTPTDTHSALFTLEGNFDNLFTLVNNTTNTTRVSFGCAVSPSKQFAINNTAEDNQATSDTWRTHVSDKCLYSVIGLTGVVDYTAAFVSWIPDGFRLSIADTPSDDGLMFSYMVINGGTWDCGNLTGPTSATNGVDTTISVGSTTPRGVLMTSAGLSAAAAGQTHAIFSVGATDGTTTNQGTIGIVDEDNQPDSDTSRINNATQILYIFGTTSALSKSATFDSFQGTTAFRLDWASGDANAVFCGWVVVADTETEAPPPAEGANGIMNFIAGDNIGAGKF